MNRVWGNVYKKIFEKSDREILSTNPKFKSYNNKYCFKNHKYQHKGFKKLEIHE